MLFGITGGSGAGKSYISDIFRKNNFFIIDADEIGHEIIKTGKPAYFELKEHFGNEIISGCGEIDRKKLASIVFSDKKSLKFLNSVTHPKIRKEIYKTADEMSEKGMIVGVDGSLLIECMIVCRPIIAVIADMDIRIKRIMERDGIGLDLAEKRMSSQKNDDFYRQSCDYVIENNGVNIEEQVKIIMDRLREDYDEKIYNRN